MKAEVEMTPPLLNSTPEMSTVRVACEGGDGTSTIVLADGFDPSSGCAKTANFILSPMSIFVQ